MYKKTGLKTDKDNFETAKIFLQKVLHRRRSFYLEEKLFQNSKKSKQLRKTLKFLGLNSKEGSTSKIWLNKDSTVQLELWGNVIIFKKFCTGLATDLVEKFPIAPNKFCSSITKYYYFEIFNNKEN